MSAIVVPRENVNDESATLVAWIVADGAQVDVGQLVAQVETSKAVVDLHAPAAGILRHAAKPGQEVPIGAEIGRVGDSAEPAHGPTPMASPAVAATTATTGTNGSAASHGLPPSARRLVTEGGVDSARVRGTGRGGRITKGDVLAHLAGPPPAQGPARFSLKAQELVAKLGLDPRDFEGRGLVRAEDLLPPEAPASSLAAPAAPPKPAPAAFVSGVATRKETLPRAKRTEGNYLRSGFESTLASVVTVACPTRGLRAALGDRATAVIVSEAAKLLRKYPAFNAYHAAGDVHFYEDVNVGFAVDAGRGLKVAVIREADRKGVAAIADEVRELVVAYLGDSLSVESLSGGTFTMTDLSGEGATAFHPLINRGQSAILGVGAESFAPGASDGTFNLILAFDHQLAEGRTAAKFLGDLRDRLAHYESATIRASEAAAEEPRCSRCQATYSELMADGHLLVQTIKADGSPRLVCRLCFEGWT